MKEKFSTADRMLCIDSVILKNRASLTVEEIEMLKEIKALLQKFDDGIDIEEKKIVTLRIICYAIRFIANPEMFEKINEAFHHFYNSL